MIAIENELIYGEGLVIDTFNDKPWHISIIPFVSFSFNPNRDKKLET